jgi:hypothetical protein
MVGLTTSHGLDEKRRLLEIARDLLREIPDLEAEAAHFTATKDLPTTKQWFTGELDAMRHNTSGDDRNVKAMSVRRVSRVVNDFLAHLSAQSVNLAEAPFNRIGPDDVGQFLADYKAKGYSGASRKFALARIRAILGHAVGRCEGLRRPAADDSCCAAEDGQRAGDFDCRTTSPRPQKDSERSAHRVHSWGEDRRLCRPIPQPLSPSVA